MTEERRRAGWKPGQSGNPKGRARGTGEIAKLRASIEKHIPAIVEKLVAQALAGDTSAGRLLLERVLPPIKATEPGVRIAMPEGSLTDQGRAVVAAAGTGELAPGQAAQLLAGLSALAKLVETDELTKRIAALEERNASKP